MAESWSLKVSDGLANLVFDDPGAALNILTAENLISLDRFLDQISSRSDIRALLLTSAKNRIFIAGADIKEIEGIASEGEAFEKAERGKIVFSKLEKLSVPTVCVINGACLGGGYELALSCRYRTTSFSPHVKIGLPEVNLGVLPGFGGSIRLPRLIGLVKALPMILQGRVVSGEEAFRLGMVDRVFPEKSLLENSAQFAKDIAAGYAGRITGKKRFSTRFLEETPVGRGMVYRQTKKGILSKTKGHYPALLSILELIAKTYGKREDSVFRLESQQFSKLAVTAVSKNLIKVFFLTEKYKKRRWTGATASPGSVKKCGVVGAGVMGGGIAGLVTSRGIPVRVKDINEQQLGGALREARSLFQKDMEKRKLKKHELENRMGLISVGLTNEGLKTCDIILEAVVEDIRVKRAVFKELSELTDARTVLASNTSSLPVSQMAEGCKDPARIVGMHFFNPVNRMPLVEVIRAKQTSDEVIERTVQFARRLGKTPILVRDEPGFLVNRILLPYLNEAAYLLAEGCSPERIDALAERFGMPMGPVELADQVGLDVAYKVARILQENFGERMKVAAILKQVVDDGYLGKKAGKGFYIYHDKKKSLNPSLRLTSKTSSVSDEDATKRMIYVMINEAARCLEEKIIDGAETVDIGMILGTGFPPFRGGLLRYADSIGIAHILQDLERFQKEADRDRFEPSALIKTMAAHSEVFYAR
jgi:3-hydroxyacyl-CoA dehydrogenase/enoyl-CoA hydratase/3-hydroxybutyryl-CoA epimerase